MKAKALHHAWNKWQLWMFFAAIFVVVTATPFARGETNSRSPQTKPAVITHTKPFGKFPLLLSTTLSLPGNEPVRPDNSTKIADALLQDSIAKEKILGDLNIQIAAMEQLIKVQKTQLEGTTSAADSHETPVRSSTVVSMPGGSSVSGVSRISGSGEAQSQPEIIAPAVPSVPKREESRIKLLQMIGLKPAMGLGLALLALLGLVGYRKYHLQVRRQSARNQSALPAWEQTLKTLVSRQDKSFGDLDMTELRK